MFKNALLSILMTAGIFAAVEVGMLARTSRLQTAVQITQTAADLDKSIKNLDVLVASATTAVNNVNATAVNEQKFLATESREFLKTTAAVKQIIVSTDYNLNKQDTGLLPKLNAAVTQQNASLLELQSQAREALAQATVAIDALPPIEKNISDTSAALSAAVTEATPEIVNTSKNINASSADVRDVADVYKKRLIHPLHSFWTGLKTALSVTASFLEIHAFWP